MIVRLIILFIICLTSCMKTEMVVYDEAIDIEGAAYEYEETDEFIEPMVADEPLDLLR